MSVQGCNQHSKVIRVSPTKCCCQHTDVYCRIGVAPKGLFFIRASPTNCGCKHTYVCCRLSHFRVAPEDQGLQGFARPVAAASIHWHTHVCCKTNQIRAARKGRYVTRFRSTRCCCKHTHAWCRTIRLRVSHTQRSTVARLGLADHPMRWAHTRVLHNTSMQSCTEGQGLQRFG